MTSNQFRIAALSHPGAEEKSHGNHPDFRIVGKIFASLGHPNDEWGMVTLASERQLFLIKEYEGVFVPATGAWGRWGCTMVHLPKAKVAVVRAAIQDAVIHVAAKAKGKGRPVKKATAKVRQVAARKK